LSFANETALDNLNHPQSKNSDMEYLLLLTVAVVLVITLLCPLFI